MLNHAYYVKNCNEDRVVDYGLVNMGSLKSLLSQCNEFVDANFNA